MHNDRIRGITITGFMGTGKTVVGKKLGERLKMEFIDLDKEIEKRADMGIFDIFSRFGEAAFREMEVSTLSETLDVPGRVVATGGGTIIDPMNLERMRSYGTIVCLTASCEEIMKRISPDNERPLLSGKKGLENIETIMEKRIAIYRESDFSVCTDGKRVDQVVEDIVRYIEGES